LLPHAITFLTSQFRASHKNNVPANKPTTKMMFSKLSLIIVVAIMSVGAATDYSDNHGGVSSAATTSKIHLPFLPLLSNIFTNFVQQMGDSSYGDSGMGSAGKGYGGMGSTGKGYGGMRSTGKGSSGMGSSGKGGSSYGKGSSGGKGSNSGKGSSSGMGSSSNGGSYGR
jgi:hypothetical protein